MKMDSKALLPRNHEVDWKLETETMDTKSNTSCYTV
jgi:hypothetical protein